MFGIYRYSKHEVNMVGKMLSNAAHHIGWQHAINMTRSHAHMGWQNAINVTLMQAMWD